tara:strand:+ start:321 stop:1007 length:687 start_codon:yes stop_codon:yes gene_type:complete
LGKRLSEKQKEEIIKSFIEGKTLDELSKNFECTKLTISRNIKKNIGDKEYKKLINQNKLNQILISNEEIGSSKEIENELNKVVQFENINDALTFNNDLQNKKDSELNTTFLEIAPLNYEIDNIPQKDISSVPISEINFPEIVYMIVNKTIELETKYLKDYPEWQFLSQNEQNRKTIQIYYDLKFAKRVCNKEQKVIKVPNTNVFKIVAPLLVSRGISRIVSEDKLIAL